MGSESVESVPNGTKATSPNPSLLVLRECFELLGSTYTGLAKLSIETRNDLFEMDPRLSQEEIYEFRSK